jgi:hypothetical protein
MIALLFGGKALWFGVPAIVGTAYFVLRLSLMLLGGIGADDVDFDSGDGDPFDLDADGGGDGDDSSGAFRVLSLQAIATFFMGFGWGALGAYRGWGAPFLLSIPVGLVTGAALTWMLAKLLRWIMGLQSSGTLQMSSALNEEGVVYVTVPGGRSGRGSVRVVVDDRMQYYHAVTDGQALVPPTRVRVTDLNPDNTITVEAANPPSLPESS